MRHSQAETMEIIRTVEGSELSVKKTLEELQINRSTRYDWYHRYLNNGYDGLEVHNPQPRQFWNRIPDQEKKQIVSIAVEHPEQSPRQLACFITDKQGYFIEVNGFYFM